MLVLTTNHAMIASIVVHCIYACMHVHDMPAVLQIIPLSPSMYTHIVIIAIRYTELRCMWKQCTYMLMVSQFTKIPHPSLSFPLPLLRFLLLYPQAHRNGNEFITSYVQLLATFRIWQKSTKAMLTFIFMMHEWVFQLLGSETMIRCAVQQRRFSNRICIIITYNTQVLSNISSSKFVVAPFPITLIKSDVIFQSTCTCMLLLRKQKTMTTIA